jgi:putative membrane protein
MIMPLQTTMGEARDAFYLRQQAEAHQRALALHQGYARTGNNPALRAVASQTAEIVQQHIGELQRITVPTSPLQGTEGR